MRSRVPDVLRAGLGILLLFQSVVVLVAPGAQAYFERQGLSDAIRLGLGGSESIAAIIFAVPRTAFLGAILLLPVLGTALGLHLALHENVGLLPVYVAGVVLLAMTRPEARG